MPVELPAGVAVLPLPWTELLAFGFKLTAAGRDPFALDADKSLASFFGTTLPSEPFPFFDSAVAVLPLAVKEDPETAPVLFDAHALAAVLTEAGHDSAVAR